MAVMVAPGPLGSPKFKATASRTFLLGHPHLLTQRTPSPTCHSPKTCPSPCVPCIWDPSSRFIRPEAWGHRTPFPQGITQGLCSGFLDTTSSRAPEPVGWAPSTLVPSGIPKASSPWFAPPEPPVVEGKTQGLFQPCPSDLAASPGTFRSQASHCS